jgi:hypothetical protein
MKKKLLAVFLGSVIFFVWSAVVHMNPITAPMGLSLLNAKEDTLMAEIKTETLAPGLYFFPGMDMSHRMTKEQQDAWMAKYKAGPTGLLLVQPSGVDMTMVSQMSIAFGSTLLCAIIAAFILTSTVGSFLRRVMVVAAIGLFAWLAISIEQWDWYEFPFGFVAVDAINQVIGWTLAGLVMAKMIKPPKQPAA